MLRTLAMVFLLSGTAAAQATFQTVSARFTASVNTDWATSSNGEPLSVSGFLYPGPSGTAEVSATITGESVSLYARATSSRGNPFVSFFGVPAYMTGLTAEARAEMIVRLRSSFPTAGYLTLSGTPSAASIDVGNDGSIEPFGPFIPIVVDELGVDIALSTEAIATAPATSWDESTVSVQFSPMPTYLDTALITCGASLKAWITPDTPNGTLRLLAQSSIDTTHTFLVFGTTRQQLALPFPSLDCAVLGTEILIAAPVAIDSLGRVSAALSLPPGTGQSVYLQFLVGTLDPAGRAVWATSNRLRILLQ